METLMPFSLPPAPAQRTRLFKAHPTPWTYGEDGIIRDAQGGVVMYDLSSNDNETCDGLYETLVLVVNSYCPMLGALQDVQKFCQEESRAVDPKGGDQGEADHHDQRRDEQAERLAGVGPERNI